jgi:hypothetical protein
MCDLNVLFWYMKKISYPLHNYWQFGITCPVWKIKLEGTKSAARKCDEYCPALQHPTI